MIGFIWRKCPDSTNEVKKAIVKARLATNTYTLQANRGVFNQNDNTGCLLCRGGVEDITHFTTECPAFEEERKTSLQPILDTIPYVTQDHPSIWTRDDLCYFIVDHTHPNVPFKLTEIEQEKLEYLTRTYCYKLHLKRAKLLGYRP